MKNQVWRAMVHHGKAQAALGIYRREGFIALGWGAIGDLRCFSGPDEISKAITGVVEYGVRRNAGSGGC